MSNFKADILQDLGDITISDTQRYRILLVRDEDLGVRISAQKWWRKDDTSEWNAGKGFFLNGRDAIKMGKLLQNAGSEILHVK